MRARASIVVAFAAAGLVAPACSGSGADSARALRATGGTYGDGSGRLGLAVLATLRDAGGRGPDAPWSGTLTLPEGGTLDVAYPASASGPGSFAVARWGAQPPFSGSYLLSLAGPDGSTLASGFELGSAGQGIAPPQPEVAPDAAALSWAPVTGAASYECRVLSDGAIVLSALVRDPGCDLGGLPPGGYSASVLAFSADLVALRASASPAPELPARLDVSEARLGLTRPGAGAPPAVLEAAGGAFDDGTGAQRTLAVWVSIRDPLGAATAVPWTVEVTGPGLDLPLSFPYYANFPRLVVWTYDVPSRQGTYGLTARSAAGALGTTFRIGTPATLPPPTGISASGAAQGGARVAWDPVPGARSYLVSTWSRASRAFVMSQWVGGTAADFPAGTFAADEVYDVYVAAIDADVAGGAAPAEFAVVENTYQPASFVGR